MIAPIIIRIASDPKPILWDAKSPVAVATSRGARNAVTVDDSANNPKNCVVSSGGEMRAMSVLDADKPVTKNMANTWFVPK